MIKIIRDLNEGLPESTTADSWRAALAECPPPNGSNCQRWCVAWGECYAQLSSGIRPIGWNEEDNTDEDGVEWFDTLEDAESLLADIEDAAKVA